MAPYQYQGWTNPYVSSISQLMERQGQIPAQAAQQAAAAQAQAAQASGQAWAGAAQNAGQAVTGAIQQATDPRRKLETAQLAQVTQQQTDLQALDKAFQLPGGRDAILQALPGHLRPTVMKQFADADAAASTVQEAALKAETATTGYVETLAEIAKAHNYDPIALQFSLTHARQTFQNNPSLVSQIGQFQSALQANPTPDTVKAIVDPILAAKDAQEKPVILPATPRGGSPAQLVRPSGGAPIATGSPAAPQPPTAESVALDAATLGTPQETPTAATSARAVGITQGPTTSAHAETLRHDQAMEAIQRMQVGREAAANAETARHNKAVEAANNPLASMTGQPQEAGAQPPQISGDEFLKTLNPNIASQVKALAEGRMAFPSGFALKSPYWQSLIQAVGQYDPTFDAVNYGARASTRKDFTSGKAATQVNALNTVLGHLNGLSDAAEALNNTDYPALNSVLNTLSKAVGRPTVTNFDTIKKAVADEVTRVWRQAGGSVEDIKQAQSNLSGANSPDQLRGAIATYGELLKSKLGSLADQYKQGMGTAPVGMLRPENQAVLDKIDQRASGQKPEAEAAAAPNAVKSALTGKGPGRYTLSDGSQWVIDGTGTIRKGS